MYVHAVDAGEDGQDLGPFGRHVDGNDDLVSCCVPHYIRTSEIHTGDWESSMGEGGADRYRGGLWAILLSKQDRTKSGFSSVPWVAPGGKEPTPKRRC